MPVGRGVGLCVCLFVCLFGFFCFVLDFKVSTNPYNGVIGKL